MKAFKVLTAAVICTAVLSACAKPSSNDLIPLLNLAWFTSYDDVKNNMGNYTLLEEREAENEKLKQFMQDYANVDLFGVNCDLTLCFTDSGLIGFNYHDIQHNQNYTDWYSILETNYGLPTEEGSGMALWYDNPLGKDTAIYLFNLEEGVQMSFYATADSPDKSYKRKGEVYIPTPEIRTPVVPVDVSETDSASEPSASLLNPSAQATTDISENERIIITDTVKSIANDTEMTAVTETEKEADNSLPAEHTNDFRLNGLQFYGSPDAERRKMSTYTQLYEYRTEEAGQPWELIMEYGNVLYQEKNCNAVLCFTSLGLVGINYLDSNTNDYNFWVQTLTEIYGTADETQYDYTAWTSSPVGDNTMIYVFALEESVQISFFTDDTGSKQT